MHAIVTGQFQAPAGKSGKITITAEKTAHVLNTMTAAGIQSAAVHGKGAIQRQALGALAPNARNVSAMLADDRPDFGLIMGQLVAEFGTAEYNRATMRGRRGAGLFLASLQLAATQRISRAETIKAQDCAIAAKARIDALCAAFEAAQERYQAARIQAARIQAEQAANMPTADATADTTE